LLAQGKHAPALGGLAPTLKGWKRGPPAIGPIVVAKDSKESNMWQHAQQRIVHASARVGRKEMKLVADGSGEAE